VVTEKVEHEKTSKIKVKREIKMLDFKIKSGTPINE